MPDAVERLAAEYREAWLAGGRPDVRDFLHRAGPGADRLADLIEAFLVEAPSLEPSSQEVAAVRAVEAGAAPLAAMRSARGVRRAAVVDAIVAAFGFARRPAVARRYHELESGLLDARRADPRLVEVIAGALGVAASSLMFGGQRPAAESAAFMRLPRGGGDAAPAMHAAPAPAAAPVPPAPQEPPDPEVDRVFGVAV